LQGVTDFHEKRKCWGSGKTPFGEPSSAGKSQIAALNSKVDEAVEAVKNAKGGSGMPPPAKKPRRTAALGTIAVRVPSTGPDEDDVTSALRAEVEALKQKVKNAEKVTHAIRYMTTQYCTTQPYKPILYYQPD
jgi:hypothetical protein